MLLTDDIARINSRDPQIEIRRWVGGLAVSDLSYWYWERKYLLTFSSPTEARELELAWSRGMLQKVALADGKYYWGVARNTRCCRWSNGLNAFEFMRFKGDWRRATIPYPADEEVIEISRGRVLGFDVFVPWLQVEPLDFERIP